MINSPNRPANFPANSRGLRSPSLVANPLDRKSEPQHQHRFSIALIAFGIFVSINWGFQVFARTAKLDRFQMSQHNWAWWATKCLQEQKQPADVLLIGSSLVQRLINEGEATYLNKPVDAITHRNSSQLESLLSAGLNRPVKTFSFAVGGLHASDASLVTSTLLKGEHQPGAIIYGIAPRDFMNGFLASPSATETFQLLNKVEEAEDVALLARSSDAEKLDFLVSRTLSKLLPLFDFRSELAQCYRRRAKEEIGALADNFVPHAHNPLDVMDLIALHMLPEEEEGMRLIFPYDPSYPGKEDNRRLYMFAYRPFRPKFYRLQEYFLERMMKTCRARGIQLILVNMPLRGDNFAVMEPGFYDRFCTDVKQLALRYQVGFIDMQALYRVPDSDFSDQVHLNGLGAVRFTQALAPRLVPLLQKPAIASKTESRQLSTK
jgi:hypothetical protein